MNVLLNRHVQVIRWNSWRWPSVQRHDPPLCGCIDLSVNIGPLEFRVWSKETDWCRTEW